MYSIFRKELSSFFSSLTGYITIIIFLFAVSWFMWISPGELNILDAGYANIDTLFFIAPWVFLFLVPAATMRSFSEEKRLGTLELVLTRPISDWQLTLGKYLASVALILLSLLPCLIYLVSVYYLASPVGNVDMGGVWGSFIGLFLLASCYAAVGIFASSLTQNQLVAFILAAVLCFLLFIGFDGLSSLPFLKTIDRQVQLLGINEHYKSVSRGVIDSRDVLYYLSIAAVFLAATVLKLKSRMRSYKLRFVGIIASILLLNIVTQHFFFRIDLTNDKRFTLSKVSKEALSSLSEPVLVHVYLDGEMPIGLKKLKQSAVEMLDELQVYANGYLQYELINPSEGSEQKRDAVYQDLFKKGLRPLMVQENDSEGGASQRMIFPCALVSSGKQEKAINFISSNPAFSEEDNLSMALQNLEFELVSAISLSSRKDKPRIAFIEGHGELNEYEVGDITKELSDYYAVDRVALNGELGGLADYSAVVVAKTRLAWNEADKLVLDQYLMNGGSIAYFIDEVNVAEDSLTSRDQTLASINTHQLDDQLFRYGVRINPNVVQDLSCVTRAVSVGEAGLKPFPWYYHPLLIPPQDNLITKNLNLVKSKYPSTIDTVGAKSGLHKTILLTTSAYSREQNAPFMLSMQQIMSEKISEASFNQPFKPIAVLVEGNFHSVFANRVLSEYNNGRPIDFVADGKPAKIVVVADGDIIRNDVSYRNGGMRIVPLGYDKDMNLTFGNKEFVKNTLLYLTSDSELLSIRKKDFTLRLLDRSKVAAHKNTLILVNIILPILLVSLAAFLFIWYRKRKYAR